MQCTTNELYHHGIKGMRWGVRRYQNKDGSLTSAGKKRYSPDELGRTPVQKGVTVKSDGSISIKKGGENSKWKPDLRGC